MNNNNSNNIKICMYRNFDDFDDFQEIQSDIYNAGKYIYEQEKLGWKIDQDEHSIAEQIYLLSLKNDYLFDKIIEECHNLIDNSNNNE